MISKIVEKTTSSDGLSNKQIKNFEIALFLGIAYASSIGGMSSLIGTAPNIVFAGFMQENFNIDISFLDWMKIALPIGLMMLTSILSSLYPASIAARIKPVEAIHYKK
mgnify:CR=1 FL=1